MPRSQSAFTSFILHLHPRTIPQETIRFGLSFGLGGMAATLLLLLLGTGLLQLLMYAPEVNLAYSSIERMYSDVLLGGWVRNIHHWSANLLVVVMVLHVMRVLATGALTRERRWNWLVGLMLFSLVLFANFSGYLLPWDQLAYWAITIFTSILSYLPFVGPWLVEMLRGGSAVGPETLTNFFAIHIGMLPVLILLLTLYHFWLIRKAGGLIRRKTGDGTPVRRVDTVPNLIVREAFVALVLIALVLLMASFFDAPLGERANPAMSPNPTKAAWYFLGIQELLLHMHPLFAVCVVPLVTTLLLALLPFWKGAVLPGGQWFGGKKENGRLVLVAFFTGIFLIGVTVAIDDVFLRQVHDTGPDSSLFFRGVLPFLFSVVAFGIGYWVLCASYHKSRAEAVMAGVALHFSFIFALTIIGIWFRGAGMQLILPF